MIKVGKETICLQETKKENSKSKWYTGCGRGEWESLIHTNSYYYYYQYPYIYPCIFARVS